MKSFNKFEVVMLFVLALLLGITPLLPSSLRPTFLYFIFNVLIVALGAEAGLLSVFSNPLEDTKQHLSVTQKPVTPPEVYEPQEEKEEAFIITGGSGASDHSERKAEVVEVLASDEKIVAVSEVDEVKNPSSMPNLLIIGGGENEQIEIANEQELFDKAEAFIGNFYKQLKMLKEIYQEAF
ncbi:uncharacterized protein LOC124833995 [Vigna umbellata]|uniref:uncharacterized protein LOC124833995 n=1 Tax=Vigna umbellata TaxID=87088 RepID=UPI001F5F065D|nr:uncharacterized protein LOC124833995 [Vigna umbellata]